MPRAIPRAYRGTDNHDDLQGVETLEGEEWIIHSSSALRQPAAAPGVTRAVQFLSNPSTDTEALRGVLLSLPS